MIPDDLPPGLTPRELMHILGSGEAWDDRDLERQEEWDDQEIEARREVRHV